MDALFKGLGDLWRTWALGELREGLWITLRQFLFRRRLPNLNSRKTPSLSRNRWCR